MANTFGTSQQDQAERLESHSATSTRSGILAFQNEQYGGVKPGAAIFGWLTAAGTTAVLAALLGAAGAAIGAATNTTASEAAGAAQRNGFVAGVTLLAVLFLAYYCGGYVAGRMARFNGMRQGIAVWVCGILIAAAVSLIAAIAGTSDALSSLQISSMPISAGTSTGAAWLLFVCVLGVTLIGAILGGLAGMAYHRKVDNAGVGHLPG